MDVLTVALALLVAIAILFEVARGLGVPYPTLFVVGGLGLALIPGLPAIQLQPELVLGIFLPPLLFIAASETPIRDLRKNVPPLIRLSIGLVAASLATGERDAIKVLRRLLRRLLPWVRPTLVPGAADFS